MLVVLSSTSQNTQRLSFLKINYSALVLEHHMHSIHRSACRDTGARFATETLHKRQCTLDWCNLLRRFGFVSCIPPTHLTRALAVEVLSVNEGRLKTCNILRPPIEIKMKARLAGRALREGLGVSGFGLGSGSGLGVVTCAKVVRWFDHRFTPNCKISAPFAAEAASTRC